MLNWTICRACGKILDSSKTICPFCGGEVDKVGTDYLIGNLKSLNFLINTVSIFKNSSPLLESTEGVFIEDIVADDLFGWFSYLGCGDGKITENEIEFINSLLDTTHTKDDILKHSDLKSGDELPLSFKYLYELDLYAQNQGMPGLNSCGELFSCYKLFGKFFITCDDEVNEEVLQLYSSYIEKLEGLLKNISVKITPLELGDEIKNEENNLDNYFDELMSLVGLENVKKDVKSLINLVQIRKIRQSRGITQPAMSLHMVFSGNPGTGKTTVARLMSKIYNEIGILSKGHLVETDRSGLVGGYVGQTAIKTQEIIQSSLGGILFIDEAYSLANTSQNDYGREAVDTLLKAMEDNRDDFIVIVAGYPELMDEFLHSNPGLESRFNKFLCFEDYNGEELYEIFISMCVKSSLRLDDKAEDYVIEYFNEMYENRSANFANGRAVRNLFEKVITAQADRLAMLDEISDEKLNTLTYEDFQSV